MAVDKRILFGSLAAAVVISIGGGWLLSTGSGSSVAPDDTSTTGSSLSLAPSLRPNEVVQGEPLPDVTLRTPDGGTISTSELVGTPLVINVWGVTCEPCKKEMPAFAAVDAELGDRVRFVGVNVAVNDQAALDFAADKGVRYELLSSEDGAFTEAMGIFNIPATLFVSADGTIVAQKGVELSAGTIRDTVQQLLLA